MDVNESPLGNIPCIFRYGNRTVNIEYSYDNVSWTASTSAATINTSSTGIIYLRVAPGVSISQIQNTFGGPPHSSDQCWAVGNSTSVYYKIEGDIRMLLNSSSPASVVTGENCCWLLWSNFYCVKYGYNASYNNQSIDCNIIVPTANTGSTGELTFASPFGSKMKRACIWKDGNWGGRHTYKPWFHLFRSGDDTLVAVTEVQLDFKSWPGSTYFNETTWHVSTPANTTYYIPNELPDNRGYYYLSSGAKISRYNAEAYGGGHA